MLFGKKKQEEWEQSLAGIERNMTLQAEKTDQQFDFIRDKVNELQKMQKRQVQSVEDFLEEEQERMDSGEVLKQMAQEGKGREENLLSLICCYQEHFHLLRQQIGEEFEGDVRKTSAWEKQFEVVGECLKRQMRCCSFEEIGQEKEPVDSGYHEILKVIETEETSLDTRVAEVFRPGCIYHGKVIKKAQVSAYRRI